MLDERQLALKPIVGESVGHNARVSLYPVHLPSSLPTILPRPSVTRPLMHKAADSLQHPRPNSIPLRRRRRNSRPGVPTWLLLLLHRHGHRVSPHILAQSQRRRERLLFPTTGRFLDRRFVRRLDEFRAYLDGVLRSLQGLISTLWWRWDAAVLREAIRSAFGSCKVRGGDSLVLVTDIGAHGHEMHRRPRTLRGCGELARGDLLSWR